VGGRQHEPHTQSLAVLKSTSQPRPPTTAAERSRSRRARSPRWRSASGASGARMRRGSWTPARPGEGQRPSCCLSGLADVQRSADAGFSRQMSQQHRLRWGFDRSRRTFGVSGGCSARGTTVQTSTLGYALGIAGFGRLRRITKPTKEGKTQVGTPAAQNNAQVRAGAGTQAG
jgi:hypothetical protein